MKDNMKKWEWKHNNWTDKIEPNLNKIIQWVSENKNISEIATQLEVSPDYLYKQLKSNQDLKLVFDAGERLLSSKVESSLINLCTGFHYKTAKTTTWFDDNGQKHQKIEEIDNYQPPNNASIQFFLKNRASERWKNDTQELLISQKSESDRKQLFMDMLNNDIKDADVIDIEPKQIDNGNK